MNTTTNAQSQKQEFKRMNEEEICEEEICEWLVTDHNGIWELVSKTETEVKEMIDEETESPNWTEYYYVQEFEDCGVGEEPKFQPINFENLLNQHMLLTAKYNELSRRFAEKAKQNEEKEKRIQGTCEFIELCDIDKDGYVNYETRQIASRLIDGNITEDED